jgi:hypothetical protein
MTRTISCIKPVQTVSLCQDSVCTTPSPYLAAQNQRRTQYAMAFALQSRSAGLGVASRPVRARCAVRAAAAGRPAPWRPGSSAPAHLDGS